MSEIKPFSEGGGIKKCTKSVFQTQDALHPSLLIVKKKYVVQKNYDEKGTFIEIFVPAILEAKILK